MFNQAAFNQIAYNRPSKRFITVIAGVGHIAADCKRIMYNTASLDASGGLDSRGLYTLGEATVQFVLRFLGTINPNDVIEIDTERMTVTINGQNALHLVDGRFWELIAGQNIIRYTDSETSRHVSLTIIFRNRWL